MASRVAAASLRVVSRTSAATRRWLTSTAARQAEIPITTGRRKPVTTADETVPPIAKWLGMAGLVPFIFYAAQHDDVSSKELSRGDKLFNNMEKKLGGLPFFSPFRAPDQMAVRQMFNTYAACILSFMGAVHWGQAMAAPGAPRASQYLFSVVPSLLGWVALNLDQRNDTAVKGTLGLGFAAVWAYDEHMLSKQLIAPWYTWLRTPLTFTVIFSLVAALMLGKPKSGAGSGGGGAAAAGGSGAQLR